MTSSQPKYLFAIFLIAFLIILLNHNSQRCPELANPYDENIDQLENDYISQMFTKWHTCIWQELRDSIENPQTLWSVIGAQSAKCDKGAELKLVSYLNKDEEKFHITPYDKDSTSVIVTLGIGKDVEAEKKLKKVLSPSTLFYGADPMLENKDIYAEVGQYYPFAVGGKAGVSKASVLYKGAYHNMDVVHIHLLYFLSQMIPKTTLFDNLLIDAEYAEYEMFHFFYKGGLLDRNDIVVCQFNIEVHAADDKQKTIFQGFIKQILEDRRFMFSKLISAAGHWRMYFVNMKNKTCKNRYFYEYMMHN